MKRIALITAMLVVLFAACTPQPQQPALSVIPVSLETDMASQTPGPTATPTATFTPAPTSTPGDLIFANGFESGTFSHWSAAITDRGHLSVSSKAALAGSYGMQAVITDTSPMYVEDKSPNAEAHYRARFYFSPNGITMAEGDKHTIFYGFSGTTAVLRLDFRRHQGVYQLMARALDNAATWSETPWFFIKDRPHMIELDWQAATAAGANNGSLTFWLDSTKLAELTGLRDDTRRIDMVRLGAVVGLDPGTHGTEYFAAFESHRDTYIGPWRGNLRWR